MKRLILSFVAVVGLLATSCVKDAATDSVNLGGESVVTFSVESSQLSRAYGEAEEAVSLYYAVYLDGQMLNDLSVTPGEEAVTLVNGAANVSLTLALGMTYDFVFWAASTDAISKELYTLDFATKKMTLNPNKLVASDESLDAFYAYVEPFKVEGSTKLPVSLKRPFAQINVATGDTAAAASAGVTVAETWFEVNNAYTTLYMGDGSVEGQQTLNYTKSAKAQGTVNVNSKNYDMLGVVYVLVQNVDSSVDVKFSYNGTTDGAALKTVAVPSVPVKRNVRTNLVGNVLTTNNSFDVDVDEDFTGEYGQIGDQSYVVVDNAEELAAAFADPDVDIVILKDDIVLSESLTRATSDPTLTVTSGNSLTIDLNGKKLSATSTQTTGNRDMFLVKGNLTVKNGTIEYEHKGENMGWNAMTTIFDITAGGVVNLEGVTAKNLGGSDMAFVAHLNNWGKATLNVENSTLEATYIAVRAFNSGHDMNNITIKNSTLKGKYCFWVHNYKAAGDSVGTDETLNVDIYGNGNTFEYTGKAPVLYGFAEPIYYDENGLLYVAEGVGKDAEGVYCVSNVAGLKWVAETVNGGEPLNGKTVKLLADLDLAGEEWDPIGYGSNHFCGTFDGNNKTISGLKVSQRGDDRAALFGTVSYTTVFKNLTISGASIECPDFTGDFYGAALIGTAYGVVTIENVDVVDSYISGNNKVAALIAHDGVMNTLTVSDCDVLRTTFEAADAKDCGSVGGLLGYFQTGGEHHITNCSVKGCTFNVANSTNTGKRANGLLIGGIDSKASQVLYIDSYVVENNTWNEKFYVNGVEVTEGKFVSPYAGLIGGERDDNAEGKVYFNGATPVAGYPNLYHKEGTNEYLLVSKESLADWNKFLLANYDRAFNNTYKLLNDIDAAGLVWACNVTFTHNSTFANGMVFDGNGKTISNLKIASNGMFQGATRSGNGNPMVAKNLTFDNVELTGGWFGGILWGDMYGPATFENVTIKNSKVTATCNVGAFVGGTCEPNHLTITFNGCSVENCTLTATGADGQDPNGASGFVGRAFADTYLVFEGNNSVDAATVLNNNNGLVGGRVYGYTTWAGSGFAGTGASDEFVNLNGVTVE